MTEAFAIVREAKHIDAPSLERDEKWAIAEFCTAVAEKLDGMPNGDGVIVDVPNGVKRGSFSLQMRKQSIRRGFRCTMRNITATQVGVYRSDLPTPKVSLRDQEIYERHADGETLEKIGQDFNLTRERIRQIADKYERFSKFPVAARKKELDDFIAPFLAIVSEAPSCVLCKGVMRKNAKSVICGTCRRDLYPARLVASRLRSFKNAPEKRQNLRNAMSAIRKYNLTPDDIRWG